MDKPNHIDLPSLDFRSHSSASKFGLPSPRIQHYDGDIPPALSPLDAFAAHSRRLAKELEETRLAGQRRMSRLPPQLITSSLSQHHANRPAIFRSLSSNSQEDTPTLPHIDRDIAGSNPALTTPPVRPKSAYPRISAVIREGFDEADQFDFRETGPKSAQESSVPRGLHQVSQPSDYFGIPQAESPVEEEHPEDNKNVAKKSSQSSQSESTQSLAPPNAAFARRAYNESSEDDYASSNAGSFFSQARKMSSSSGVSLPQTPATPALAHQRTPSNHSTTSLVGGMKLPPRLNFSRPRSSASLHTKVDSPTRPFHRTLERQISHVSDSEVRGQTSFDDARSVMSDGHHPAESSSYTHSKFKLPRGRPADRTSTLFSALSTPHFEWQEPMFPGTPPISASKDAFDEPSPMPLDRRSEDSKSSIPDRGVFSFEFEREKRPSVEQLRRPSSSGNISSLRKAGPASSSGRPSTSHGAQKLPNLPPIPGSKATSTIDEQSRSSRSNSTVRPSTSKSSGSVQPRSSDEHVATAIKLHESDNLKESTYHLRIAAKQNHPTGMLLYALACRHGWGMRPNQVEGVAWLKRAVDYAMLEVADDEDADATDAKVDFHEKKAHRAQFALSIYELGVSHLNGWGVEQDKVLALRCFEIAGNWGDPDALTEAGFCYAQGIGCKKDLKKAARFYRKAADKGVSMVGNSWIYKEKYNDINDQRGSQKSSDDRPSRKDSSADKPKEKVARSKSKTRSIFGRKKSSALAPTEQ